MSARGVTRVGKPAGGSMPTVAKARPKRTSGALSKGPDSLKVPSGSTGVSDVPVFMSGTPARSPKAPPGQGGRLLEGMLIRMGTQTYRVAMVNGSRALVIPVRKTPVVIRRPDGTDYTFMATETMGYSISATSHVEVIEDGIRDSVERVDAGQPRHQGGAVAPEAQQAAGHHGQERLQLGRHRAGEGKAGDPRAGDTGGKGRTKAAAAARKSRGQGAKAPALKARVVAGRKRAAGKAAKRTRTVAKAGAGRRRK